MIEALAHQSNVNATWLVASKRERQNVSAVLPVPLGESPQIDLRATEAEKTRPSPGLALRNYSD